VDIRILHIDDDHDQCTFVKLFLEQLNPIFRVTTVQEPGRLMRLVKDGDYDCVVSDFKMPFLNGIDLVERVRGFSNIPFILYTGQGSDEVAEQAFTKGANYYVKKESWPSHYHVLERSIITSVEKYRAEERLRQSQRELSWMAENNSDSIVRIEFGVGVTWCNKTAEKILGIRRGNTFNYESMRMRIHPEDRHKVSPLNEVVFEKSKQENRLIRWLKNDDEDIWLDANIIPMVLDNRVIGVDIIARDITERVKAEETLNHRVQIERMIGRISEIFSGLDDADGLIDGALGLIGELSGACRAYLFEFREDGEEMDNTHEWCAEGVSPEKHNLQRLPKRVFPWWMKKLEKGENIRIKDVSKLPQEASAERALLESQGIKSLLVIPFYVNRRLAGFMGFDNVKNTRSWEEDDVALLRVSADIIGSAKLRQKIVEERVTKQRVLLENVAYF